MEGNEDMRRRELQCKGFRVYMLSFVLKAKKRTEKNVDFKNIFLKVQYIKNYKTN